MSEDKKLPEVDKKDVSVGQGENANGEKDSRSALEQEADAKQATSTIGGVTKVTREAGRDRSKDATGHVVQQGGGGAVSGDTGEPI